MSDGKVTRVRVEKRALRGSVIALDLPFPPSTNHLFPTIGKNRIASEEYVAWKRAAGWEIKSQRPHCAIGPVEVSITLEERTRRMDLDNRIKALLDLIVEHGIIEGDHNKIVRKITAQWGAVIGAHVEISPAPNWIVRREIKGRAA